MSDDNLLPKWAVDLTVQIAELNAKLSPHIDWVERNVKDHEIRLRSLERDHVPRDDYEKLAAKVDEIDAENDANAWLPKIVWAVIGAAIPILITFILK
ncbi:hypothetical protein ACFSYH_01885 [Populibacterium corticicola]|uniref:DUF1640 domain-containing protein n=1 Tax=Populibacterium corticicola TaxID=1812826 RepID=A0ABW5XDP8_9MICO